MYKLFRYVIFIRRIKNGKTFKKIRSIFFYPKKDTEIILDKIKSFNGEEGFAIYNPECLGIMNSTKDLFKNCVGIKELLNKNKLSLYQMS